MSKDSLAKCYLKNKKMPQKKKKKWSGTIQKSSRR